MHADKAHAGRVGGRASGLARAKQGLKHGASDSGSTVLQHDEAPIEAKTTQHNTTQQKTREGKGTRRDSLPTPADFTVTDVARQWARSNGLGHIDIDSECAESSPITGRRTAVSPTGTRHSGHGS